ncbi:hypothetical protein ACIHCM_33955 [Streptomyces sp. NPDC052023]|uniref:hypothetical protein n=1 Tax=Streptomyces sp. NPDC052023 TaxID=3365681 RepID=UPI0037D53A31
MTAPQNGVPGRQPERGESGGQYVPGCLPALIGIGALIFAIVSLVLNLGFDPNAAPDCGGETMTPGQRCADYSGNDGGGTYEEMQEKEKESHDNRIRIYSIAFPLAILCFARTLYVWFRPTRGRQPDGTVA